MNKIYGKIEKATKSLIYFTSRGWEVQCLKYLYVSDKKKFWKQSKLGDSMAKLNLQPEEFLRPKLLFRSNLSSMESGYLLKII